VRGDWAYCSAKVVAAVVKAGATFSFAIVRNPAGRETSHRQGTSRRTASMSTSHPSPPDQPDSDHQAARKVSQCVK
jgi:hypothetical protein